MGTTANSVLDQRLSQVIGDWIEEAVTTALTTSTAVASTNLNKWDEGNNDHFNTQWVYVTNYKNAGQDRKIYDYATSGGVCSVRGANFLDDGSDKATCRFYRYSYTAKQRAINDAIRELSDVLFRAIDDRSLATGQILPDRSFEWWTTSAAPKFYSGSANATLTQTSWSSTNDDYIRGQLGSTSMKVLAGAADQYAYIDSTSYPRLLDLKNKSIDIGVWAYPSTANDAFMDVVYTLAGTSTTVSTTTTCGASRFTLLYRDGISIPDDIEKIEFRFRVHTNGESAYFDNARVNGHTIREYMLPETLQDGEICQVYVQTTGYSDEICDDLMPAYWERVYGSQPFSDGTYRYIRLPALYGENSQIRLIGTSPLSTVSAFSDTIEIDGNAIDLLVNYAAYKLFMNEAGVPSGEDTTRFRQRAQEYLREYYRLLPSLRMTKPSGTLILPTP